MICLRINPSSSTAPPVSDPPWPRNLPLPSASPGPLLQHGGRLRRLEKGRPPHRAGLSLRHPVATDPYEAQRPIIDALSSPATYPPRDGVDTVEVRETHSAVVFLAGSRAYKMKKAVDYGFLDFTTLLKRRYFCYQELFLNQRAAPDVYREVRAVIPNGRGGYPHRCGRQPRSR